MCVYIYIYIIHSTFIYFSFLFKAHLRSTQVSSSAQLLIIVLIILIVFFVDTVIHF